MSYFLLSTEVGYKGEADVWIDGPTPKGIILYSVLIPIFGVLGVFGNIISLIVLKRKELVGSVYTYLAVIAFMDLCSSILLIIGGICRGIMWHRGWAIYDSLICLPLDSALNTLGVLSVIGLTIDRVIYLWNPVQCTKPKFCHSWVARRIMLGSFVTAIVFNLPYCFIYEKDHYGNLTTTGFFDSKFYRVFNWVTLFLFSVVPGIILLLGNGFLIMSLRMAKKINKNPNKCRRTKCKRRDHTNLTVTLVMIIIFFLVTNIPEDLVSRTAAINLLFHGDHDKANTETLETLRQICTIVEAINVNTNFVFCYTFSPAFCKILKRTCLCRGRRPSNVQVNVFVLNANESRRNRTPVENQAALNRNVQKVLEISRKSLESAFALNLGNITGNNGKHNLTQTTRGECFEVNNEYTPEFSAIMEESSSCNAKTDASNKQRF